MPLYLGVDDTDSLRGMCTTFLATELVRALPKWDLIGFPRLVRLNPNIPWKTRGNGAICLRLGQGPGRGARGGAAGRGGGRAAVARAPGPPPQPPPRPPPEPPRPRDCTGERSGTSSRSG